ncbi:MAG: ankyrin repeat domain-containing protein [Chlamydiales bacterium]
MASTSYTVINYPLSDIIFDIENEMKERSKLPLEDRKYILSPYALDLAIIEKIDLLAKSIIEFYEDDPTTKDFYNSPTGRWKLTPLHLSVICNDIATLEALLKAGADPNVLDIRNWSPLHHAALLNHTEMVRLLIQYQANVDAKTITNGLYTEISLLAYHPQSLRQNDGDPFLRLKDYAVNPQIQCEEWAKGVRIEPTKILGFIEEFRPGHEEHRSNPIPRRLEKITVDSMGHSLPSTPGLGLSLEEDVESKTVIGEYLGVREPHQSCSAYVLNFLDELFIDAKDQGDEMSRANDGFPNAGVVLLPNSHQMAVRPIFVTLDLIKRSEQICWNYGFDDVKLGPYVELRPRELRDFVKSMDWNKCYASLMRQLRYGDNEFSSFILAEKLRYILQTPTAVFQMILDGTISGHFATNLFSIAYKSQLIPQDMQEKLKPLVEIAASCKKTYDRTSLVLPQFSKKYLNYIQGLPAKVGIISSLNVTKQIVDFLNSRIIPRIGDITEMFDDDDEQALIKLWQNVENKANEQIAKKTQSRV